MNSVNLSPSFGKADKTTKPNKQKKSNDFIQAQTGYMAGGAITGAVCSLSTPALNNMIKINNSLPADEAAKLFESAKQALAKSGVADKVSIHAVTEKTPMSIIGQTQVEIIDKLKLPKKVSEFLKNTVSPEYTAVNGKNAFFNPATQKVIYNPEKFGLSAFHEIGHAINRNASKIGKTLQAMRNPAMALAGVIMMVGVAAKSKSRVEHDKQINGDSKKEGFGRKAMSFIRDNAGKLSFAAMLPIVAEEAMATMKGNKLAKSLLSPEMFKKVRISNALGLATYAISAVGAGIGAWAAVKIKDKMVANKIAKQEAKAQQA